MVPRGAFIYYAKGHRRTERSTYYLGKWFRKKTSLDTYIYVSTKRVLTYLGRQVKASKKVVQNSPKTYKRNE